MEDAPPVTLDTAMTEADFSNKHLGVSGAIILAGVLRCKIFQDSRSLSKLTFNGCVQGKYGDWEEGDQVTIDTTMTEADFSGKKLGLAGAQVLAAFMSTKLSEAKGSLSSLDLSKNNLRSEGLSAVSEVLKSTSIRQLNIAENYLTFNMQDKRDMSGVIKFAEDMKDMGSLSKLDISGNQICGLNEHGQGTYDASGLAALAKSIGNLKELNISSNLLKAEGARILAPVIEASGSLASLTISNNRIGDKQQAKIKEICAGMSITCAL
jgi:Leucine-rich repeat (LRR) protein